MAESLAGRQIILAGGSGGLGSAAAELLSTEGVRLVVSYKSNASRASQLVRFGVKLVQSDLTDAGDRKRLLAAAPELYGLVVFAGEAARETDPAKLEAAIRRSNEANFTGPILLAREAADRMKEVGMPGAIVLFSTMQAAALFPGSTAYAGAKAALLHAARVLAKECRGASGIRINVICPGVIAAGMAETSIASGKYSRFLENGSIHRYGRAMDVARAVRFFLEPDNYITGQALLVDGGLTL